METKKTAKSYSPEVKERAVRMVIEHQGEHASQWTAIGSIAAKIGCSGETLRKWLRQHERDAGLQDGVTSEVRDRLKALERENRELRQANEIPGLRRGRLCARPRPILPRRSSTAGSNHDRLHRRAPRRPRVEPICRVLPIAPSTYHAHAVRRTDPGKLPARAQ